MEMLETTHIAPSQPKERLVVSWRKNADIQTH